MKWLPIESFDTDLSDDKRAPVPVLLFGEFGVKAGAIYKYVDGEISAQAYGFNGAWKVTHWMPLPEPPQ